jgi:hypothetical protein
MELTNLEREFLGRIVARNGMARSRECGLGTRPQDRARQRCRKLGLVVFKNAHWHITIKGREALAGATGETHELSEMRR